MRVICCRCHYPLTTCVCAHISKVESPVEIVILQHSKEAAHAKNTVKLITLCLSNTKVIVGKSAADFAVIRQQLASRQSALIYPTDTSQGFESTLKNPVTPLPSTLVFIDASWRQAYAIWQGNPWLHSLAQYHFEDAPNSEYQIRHTKLEHSLSTLEAVAYSLSVGYKTDSQPLLRLQAAMQSMWRGPNSHRRTN